MPVLENLCTCILDLFFSGYWKSDLDGQVDLGKYFSSFHWKSGEVKMFGGISELRKPFLSKNLLSVIILKEDYGHTLILFYSPLIILK